MIEKQLRGYIVPNILAMTGISCYVLADTFFISKAEGVDGITALNLMLPVFSLIFAIGSMIGIGSATRYTLRRALGKDNAGEYFSNSVISTLIISLPFVLCGIFIPQYVLNLLGADDDIIGLSIPYLRIILCCTPFFMLNYTFTSFVRNDGAPRTAMAATLTSGGFNILFDYIFMFPMKMGLTGAALATGISPAVSMLVCMSHFLSERSNIRLQLAAPSLSKLISACALGTFSFVGEMSGGLTTMVFNFILLKYDGNIGVAAYGITANIAIVGNALFSGVSQGLQPLASDVHGKGETDAERQILRYCIKLSLIIAFLMIIIVMLFASPITDIFNSSHSEELANRSEYGMRLYFVGFIFAAVNIISAGYFSATDRGRASAVISISRGVAAITVFAFILSAILGTTGIWLAFPASELFTLMLTTFCLKRRNINTELH